jgi:serine protein kinase
MQPDVAKKSSLVDLVAAHQKVDRFRELLWEGNFEEYLEIVRQDPRVARNAYQRLYDLVASYGSREYTEYKKTIVRHHFFDTARSAPA